LQRVVVVGCGVIGAAIAYELSQFSSLAVTVLDRQLPAQAATGAALGVMMGAISQKAKGHNLQRRLLSLQQYEAWFPQLEAVIGHSLSYNRQGILRLCFEGEDLQAWRSLAQIRAEQGWLLHLLALDELSATYPYLSLDRVIGAVYSPRDRQVDPVALTQALVAASRQRGVQFEWNAPVDRIEICGQTSQVYTPQACFISDWLVIAAGLGSVPLTAQLNQAVDLHPVLGQAVRMRLSQPLATVPQPVITGEDTHIVPIAEADYWVGATVEFPNEAGVVEAEAAALEVVLQRAIALCPLLGSATLVQSWSGLRPRPQGRPAPIVERLPGQRHVLVATGHYRNGVLLAPATAIAIRELILQSA